MLCVWTGETAKQSDVVRSGLEQYEQILPMSWPRGPISTGRPVPDVRPQGSSPVIEEPEPHMVGRDDTMEESVGTNGLS